MVTDRNFNGWTKISPLGSGGQSDVFLVRSPARQSERIGRLDEIRKALDGDQREKLANAICDFARADSPSELGALKVFKIPSKGTSISPPPGYEPIERLRNEISILKERLPGFPKLLDSNEDERWIVTEYFPDRTLELQPRKFRGKVVPALKAFRSLVQATSSLHAKGFVHRDIKPANVFINGDDLILGDFGIVYVPNVQDRVTRTDERVGPRDFMPQWANLGARLENVSPRFDVYMLGKLLWSMLDGRAVLPREYHGHPEHDFDLTKTFPEDLHMHLINSILDACVVERERDCLSGAQDLLIAVETTLRIIKRGGQLIKDGVPRPCHVCGTGFYRSNVFPHTPALPKQGALGLRFWFGASEIATVPVYPFICDYCGHVELFTRAGPGV